MYFLFVFLLSDTITQTNACMMAHTHMLCHFAHPPPPPPTPPHSLCWVSADIFIWDMYIADIYMAVRFGSTWGRHSVGKRFPDAH